MTLYDLIIKKIMAIQEKTDAEGPVTNISASSVLTAEITLISTILLAMIMLRLVNKSLMIVAVLLVLFISIMAMPLMPRIKKELNDSLAYMMFYMIIALALIITLFYWGSLNV
jgi:energy-converting hydrogenase B subunit G